MVFGELFNIFLRKKKISQLVQEKPSLGSGLVSYIAAYIIYAIVLVIAAAVGGTLLASMLLPQMGEAAGAMGAIMLGAAVAGAVAGLVGGIIGMFIGGIIFFIFAKLFGGKGTGYISFMACLFKVSASVTLLSAIVMWIPLLGLLLAGLFSLYAIFLSYELIKNFFALSTLRAILVLVIPIVLLLLLVSLLAVSFISTMGSLAGAGIGAGMMPFAAP